MHAARARLRRAAPQVRSNLQRAGRFGHVIVPRVHAELCTRKLLVMEEVYPSTPLHVALDRQAAKQSVSGAQPHHGA